MNRFPRVKQTTQELIFGEGTYNISRSIDISQFSRIRGVPGQTTIKCSSDITNMIVGTSIDGFVIEDLIIDANSQTDRGIRLNNCSNGLIRNIHVKNTTDNGVVGQSGGSKITFSNVTLDNCHSGRTYTGEPWGYQGWYFDNGSYSDMVWEYCDGDMLLVATSTYDWSRVKLIHHRSIDATRTGIELINTGTGVWDEVHILGGVVTGAPFNAQVSLSGVDDFIVDGMFIDGESEANGLEVAGCERGKIVNCDIRGGDSESVSVTSTSRNIIIAHNRFSGFVGSGINNAADYSQIINNHFYAPEGTNSYAITLTSNDWCICSGNTIEGTLDASNKIKKGIMYNTGANTVGVSIVGNLIKDCTEHGIYLYGGSAQTVDRMYIAGNIGYNNNVGYASHANISLTNSDVASPGLGF